MRTRNSHPRDILSTPLLDLIFFCLPAAAIGVTALHSFSNLLRTVVWTLALVVMGVACLVNASRCGRLHCYLTGPFFLLTAVITLLFGLGILHLGRNGWGLISAILVIGAVALSCLPEMFLGKYRRDRPGH